MSPKGSKRWGHALIKACTDDETECITLDINAFSAAAADDGVAACRPDLRLPPLLLASVLAAAAANESC